MRSLTVPLVLLALAACSRERPAAPATTPPGPAATPSAPAAQAPAFVVTVVTLRREPVGDDRIAGPGGKRISNYLSTTLQRGERVALVEAREDWLRVRASDDTEGWLRAATVLDGAGVSEATVLQPTDVFDRPDLLAANARRKVDPGSLLLVVKERAPFTEVNVPGAQNAWVLTERLVRGEREVGVAKLGEKARWLARNGRREEALQIVAFARQQFPEVPIVQALEEELTPPPAEPTPPGDDAR